MRRLITAWFRSFHVAFRGIGMMLKSEINARIHLAITIIVIVAGMTFQIDRIEWLAVIIAITVVWISEAFNTAIEALCDLVTPEQDPKIGRIKDIAAGAVLLAAGGAVGVAILVFGRRLLALLG
ncbi:MAG: diacylglycerol kinase family protein [Myxococcota bacterium]